MTNESTPVKPVGFRPGQCTAIAGTHACGARWSRAGACHCASCHRTFTSLSGFDTHRRGMQCLDPENIVTSSGKKIDMVQRTDKAGCVMWGFPGREERDW